MPFARDIKSGSIVEIGGSACKVDSVVPDGAEVRFVLFDLTEGTTVEKVMNPDDEVPEAGTDQSEYTVTEKTDNSIVFKNTAGTEELEVPFYVLGENAALLRIDETVNVRFVNGIVAAIDLPKIVIQSVESTEDIEKDSGNKDYVKEAVLQNGRKIMVPAFIKTGERIKIHLDTGEYIRRDEEQIKIRK